jgi:hypothetical protein
MCASHREVERFRLVGSVAEPCEPERYLYEHKAREHVGQEVVVCRHPYGHEFEEYVEEVAVAYR